MPLLCNGDRDLQQAIYDAVSADLVAIVDGAGVSVAVTAAAQVKLSKHRPTLAKPQTRGAGSFTGNGSGENETTGEHDQIQFGDGVTGTPGSPGALTPVSPTRTERQINFSFTQNLLATSR